MQEESAACRGRSLDVGGAFACLPSFILDQDRSMKILGVNKCVLDRRLFKRLPFLIRAYDLASLDAFASERPFGVGCGWKEFVVVVVHRGKASRFLLRVCASEFPLPPVCCGLFSWSARKPFWLKALGLGHMALVVFLLH